MKKQILLIAIIAVNAAVATAAGRLEDDMKIFFNWFEGRFDNFAQTAKNKETKAEHPHEWIHSIFKRVDLPQIGKHVFYVQQYMDGDETKIYRQRLYTFDVDKKEKAIVLKIYTFPDEKAVINAHLDPSKLNGLSLEKLDSPKGCEVYWRLNAARDKFEGSMKPEACRVVSKRSGRTIIISDDLFLTKDEIWIRDQAKDDKGNYVFGNKANIHHKLRKVRWFEGWTAVLKSGETTLTGADFPAADYDGKLNLLIHDQGGIQKINDRFSVQLAQLQHRSGVWVMTLSLIENNSGGKVAYSWADADAERIGLNLRWIQAGFTLKR